MDKKLIIGLALVVIIGGGAHLSLNKLDHVRIEESSFRPDATKSNDEMIEEVENDVSVAEADVVVTPSATTPSNPDPEQTESVADILDGFDDEEEDYDDTSVDADFSGNLDESI